MGAVKTNRMVQAFSLNNNATFYVSLAAEKRTDKEWAKQFVRSEWRINNRRRMSGKPMIRRAYAKLHNSGRVS